MDNTNPFALALASRLAPNQRSVVDPRAAIAERLLNFKPAPVTGRGEGIAQALAAALSGAGGAYLSGKMRDDQQREHREGLAALLTSTQQFDQRQLAKEQREREGANEMLRSLGIGGAPTPAPAAAGTPMPSQQMPAGQPAAPVAPVAQEGLPPTGGIRAANSQFAQQRSDAMSRLQGPELDAELAKISGAQASAAQGIPQGTQFRANPGIGGVFAGVPAPAPGVPAIPQRGGAPQPIEAGNIDLNNRPRVRNADGSISTVRSMGVNIDGQEVLIPTVSDDGRIMSDREAIDQYRNTGRHLGKFRTPEESTAFAENLHTQQERQYVGTAGQPPQQQTPRPVPQSGGQPDLRMAAAASAASGNPLMARMAPMLGQMAASRERDQDRREDRDWRTGEAGRAQSNADRAFALQQEQARLAADREGRAADQAGVPAGYRRSAAGALEFIPGGPADPAQVKSAADARGGGRALPSPERTSLVDAGGRASEIGSLRNTFQNDYGGYRAAIFGDAANAVARNSPGESPRADWWQRYQSQKNVVRNQLFGAALTATEAGEFEKADINPGMSSDMIRSNLTRQQHIIESALRRRARSLAADNYSKAAIEEATGISLQDAAPEPDRRPPSGGDAPSAHPALPPGFTVVQ